MSRPHKYRRICSLPVNDSFGPNYPSIKGQACVDMTVDEYETIRLIDLLGYTQEECARQMAVARTTVQAVYGAARRKIADSLVNGKQLVIHGGSYALCRYSGECCEKDCGRRHCENREMEVAVMKVAVTYQDGQVFQHFGHTEQFKIYEVSDKKILSEKVVDTNGSGHGALAGFLKEYGVDSLICGGIGQGARTALAEAGIQVYPGTSGNADEQIAAFLSNELNYNPDTICAEHEHHEGHCHSGHCKH